MPFGWNGNNQQSTNKTAFMNEAIRRVANRYAKQYKSKLTADSVVSSILVIVTPFLSNVFQKYSEADFHRAMSGSYIDEDGRQVPGFDFIGDWAKNHNTAFPIMLYLARMYKKDLNFNTEIASKIIVEVMREWGWTVNHNEVYGIRYLFYRIKKVIFS